MRVDPDSRSAQGLTTFLQFVALNVLYIVACVPVVTAGAATAALYEVALRYADEERGYLITGFLAGAPPQPVAGQRRRAAVRRADRDAGLRRDLLAGAR